MEIKTDIEYAHIIGRNGLVPIKAIDISLSTQGGGFLIQGVGRRNTIINGGFRINRQAIEPIIYYIAVYINETIKKRPRGQDYIAPELINEAIKAYGGAK